MTCIFIIFLQKLIFTIFVFTMSLKSDFHPNGYLILPPSSDIRDQYWTCAQMLKAFNTIKLQPNGKTRAIYLQGLFWKYLNMIYSTYGTHSIFSKQQFVHDVVKAGTRLMAEVEEGKPEDGFTVQFYDTYYYYTYPELQTFFHSTIQNIS
jgi:hypothetical protein